MKTLIVANRPPDSTGTGDAKVAYRVCEALSMAGHSVQIVVLSQTRPSPLALTRALYGLFRGRPLQIGLTSSQGLQRKIAEIIVGSAIDVIIAIHARATANVTPDQYGRTIGLIIDCYGRSYRTYWSKVSPVERAVYGVEAVLMARYERKLTQRCAKVVVLSQSDADHLAQGTGRRDVVARVPYGVDIEFFRATPRRPTNQPAVFGFVGRLNYRPNRDAVRHLVNHYWPALRRRWPNARLRVVGADPGPELRRFLLDRRVELAADVADVRQVMSDLTAMIVPLRMGGGVQTKILEAMAARIPVICSSFANEGIAAPPNQVVLIANTPAECVDQAQRLLQEPNFEAKLSLAGFDWVVAQHAPELFDRSITGICMQVLAAQDP